MLFKSKFFSIIILSVLLMACSSDDDGDLTQPEISSDQSISYSENQSANTTLGTVQASDNDEIIAFSIASGNSDNFFAISDSGAISLTDTGVASAANDFEMMPNDFTLGIIAEDASSNLSDVVDVTLEVTDDEQDNSNYFPLVVDNTWNYANVVTTDNNSEVNNETMFISDQNMVNDTLFFQAETDNMSANLRSTSILTASELFKKSDQLQAKGQFDNFGQDLPGNITLPIQTNIIPIYSTSAGANASLFSETGNFTETIEGIDIEIDFELSTQNAGSMDSMETNGTVYDDVIASTFILNMEISATIMQGGFPITITILDDQDVITATHYFANEIGMIRSETVVSFDFADLSQAGINLEDINSTTVQELESSTVSLP